MSRDPRVLDLDPSSVARDIGRALKSGAPYPPLPRHPGLVPGPEPAVAGERPEACGSGQPTVRAVCPARRNVSVSPELSPGRFPSHAHLGGVGLRSSRTRSWMTWGARRVGDGLPGTGRSVLRAGIGDAVRWLEASPGAGAARSSASGGQAHRRRRPGALTPSTSVACDLNGNLAWLGAMARRLRLAGLLRGGL